MRVSYIYGVAVYEIMIKWVEHRDWEKAFAAVIPQRKLKDSKWIKDGEEEEGAEKQETGVANENTEKQQEDAEEKEEEISQEIKEESNTEKSVWRLGI